MNNNQLQRVTRRQAGMLKLAGFDWETRGNYAGADEELYMTVNPENHNRGDFFVSAPTVALALKWMREVKGFHTKIEANKYSYEPALSSSANAHHSYRYAFQAYKDGEMAVGGGYAFQVQDAPFSTYESAESALLDELLELIKK